MQATLETALALVAVRLPHKSMATGNHLLHRCSPSCFRLWCLRSGCRARSTTRNESAAPANVIPRLRECPSSVKREHSLKDTHQNHSRQCISPCNDPPETFLQEVSGLRPPTLCGQCSVLTQSVLRCEVRMVIAMACRLNMSTKEVCTC
jgi:hypothetical protein